MKTVAVIQARMGSTRLPGKVLMDLAGRPVIGWVVRAAQHIRGIDKVVVATSDAAADDAVAAWCADNVVACHRGLEDDVLDRFAAAAAAEGADVVLRLTGDCPFLDPDVCSQVVRLRALRNTAYASNVDPASWPDGLDCEVMTAAALAAARAEAVLVKDREHVTPFIRARRDRFPAANLPCALPGMAVHRWTLDTPEDMTYLAALAAVLPVDAPPSFLDVLAAAETSGAERVDTSQRNEGAATAWRASFQPGRRYDRSQDLLRRAEQVIPLGSQTFSKSHIQFPQGHTPLFLSHGAGGRCWDVDGNEFIDMMGGLLPVVLGYRDPEVDAAVRDQLDRGITFSLATELEAHLAELLVKEIPCAEKVRFGKNGTDATSGAVRVARAATGRDRIAVCGYHGWQDWYIGSTTRSKGVPGVVRSLTHTFPYANIDALDELLGSYPGEFAAVIMEPMNVMSPPAGYLAAVRDTAHQHGALLIFDEVITGFRFALGGAQSLFGVTPDLASFGKAMGNGMPISAVVGLAGLLDQMEDIFFSSTFGGETLSLAAAIATVEKMQREPVIDTLWKSGTFLNDAIRPLIADRGLADVIQLKGLAPWTLAGFQARGDVRAEAIRTLWLKVMLDNGVLSSGSHNVCYAHNAADLKQVTAAWTAALDATAEALAGKDFDRALGVPVIESIFKVR